MAIDTKTVTARRHVSYASIQEILDDAERLSRTKVKTLGNWSQGQIYSHLAIAMTNSIDGTDMKIPWWMRTLARLVRKNAIKGPMQPGFKLSTDAARVLVPGPKSTEDGLAELRTAIRRLQSEPKRVPHAAFGSLSDDEWNQLQLTHSALHMSFIVEEP
jgi:hypothetical protein